jgi:4-hydroxy-tetrahydrodipicolinate reductase
VRATIAVVVSGALGQMGATVCRAVEAADDMRLAARVDPAYAEEGVTAVDVPAYGSLDEALGAANADVVVDFTRPEAALGNILTCVRHGTPIVVGTSGLDAGALETARLEAVATGTPVFVAPNFALGAVLMMRFAREAARHFVACEVVELHHDRKLDAPSGTAARTGELIQDVWREGGSDRVVPIHSVRLPGLVAHQEVIFGGLGQTLTIRHDSLSRESFMPGVLLAIRSARGLQGLVVGLENLL